MALTDKLTAVADAIREMDGSADKLTLDQMPQKIRDIATGTDTSDATAAADDIAEGKTAYVNGERIVGSIKEVPNIVKYDPSLAEVLVVSDSSGNMPDPGKNGIYIGFTSQIEEADGKKIVSPGTELEQVVDPAEFGDAAAADVASGKTFTSAAGLKVTGTHECAAGLDTSDATAGASDILSGKTAYANGQKITGSIALKAAQTITPGTADQTLAAGQYLSGAQTIKGDANLIPGNIKSGVSIFGVTGSHEGSSGGGSLVSKSGSTTTPSFDTGLSEIVAIIIDKASVNSTGLTEASFVPILGKGTVSGCSSYSTYMKQYASKISSNSCNVEGGTFNWEDTNSTYAFKEGDTYSWFAIGYE